MFTELDIPRVVGRAKRIELIKECGFLIEQKNFERDQFRQIAENIISILGGQSHASEKRSLRVCGKSSGSMSFYTAEGNADPKVWLEYNPSNDRSPINYNELKEPVILEVLGYGGSVQTIDPETGRYRPFVALQVLYPDNWNEPESPKKWWQKLGRTITKRDTYYSVLLDMMGYDCKIPNIFNHTEDKGFAVSGKDVRRVCANFLKELRGVPEIMIRSTLEIDIDNSGRRHRGIA